uniref:Ammonium transporter n=1 Tax=Lotharella globosa TaxID=91324 RepID=A0A7S3YJB5_9EUKA|eukprot:CAMPEP_0167795918 /NCGR_PEP_ID=MMETSP0111_2-20121227/14734_1 /TAXON_ID=91324 /ORGANISM="Lotharella globosa, Strain CCCM811" /LENGTH=498 /DNA_ID=CAMNT_0007689703 /DNA_START=522 /DNA_END=2018 /DNA_ORIENTATION=-
MSSGTCFYASGQEDSSIRTAFDVKVCLPASSTITVEEDSAEPLALSFVTDVMWVLTCAILVFWMQAGFAMLEAGSVRKKNTNNILFKNLMDASIGAICFWLLGYSFAYGNGRYAYDNPGNDNKFIGSGNWALQNFNDDTQYHSWFFQWAFAGAAATIVSGSVAERCRLEGYFVYTIILTTFIYPIVVHWVWSGTGWLSAFYIGDDGEPFLKENGMIDFAGSGVVHMVGGFAGLMGAIAIGPRRELLSDDPEVRAQVKGHSDLLCALGVSILWMGWYGFNCGSTLGAGAGNGSYINLASKVAVTTTIAAAMGAITTMLYSRFFLKSYVLTLCLNGVLAGLVSITAPCSVVEPWAAMMIGIIGAIVYICASNAIKCCGIDDPLDAFPVHGMCGMWGVLSVGIFATRSNIKRAYGFDNDAMTSGNQFRNQLIGVLAIAGWTVVTSGLVFFTLKFTGLLRVSEEEEKIGLDASEHGVEKPKGVEMGEVKDGSVANKGSAQAV